MKNFKSNPSAFLICFLSILIFFLCFSLCLGAPNKDETAKSGGDQASYGIGMFDLYEENRTKGIPNYITSDFLMLSYALIRQQAVTQLEQERIRPLFTTLVNGLSQKFKQGKTPHHLANRDFIAVLNALLKGETTIKTSAGDQDRADRELSVILGAENIDKSPLWEIKMDYTLFKPRGIYSNTPMGQQYFRAIKYAGSVLFALKESRATGVTTPLANRLILQAMELVKTIRDDKALASAYRQINELLVWEFGQADDLTFTDMVSFLTPDRDNFSPEALRKALFDYARNQGKIPKIHAGLVDLDRLEKEVTPADVLAGWRLFPQSYTPDAAVFQDLVFGNVGEYKGKATPFGLSIINGKPVKGFASANELMALLGSRAAKTRLEKGDEKNFTGYEKAAIMAGKRIANARGLSALQLGFLNTLLAPGSEKHDKTRLESALSFWTWQRYTGVLYNKQSVTGISKSVSLSRKRESAFLEPCTPIYLSLYYMARQHAAYAQNPVWDKFSQLLAQCIKISFKIANQGMPGEADISFLNRLDQALLTLTRAKDHPIVVDVHTEPNSGLVVEEGTGLPKVVFPEPGVSKKAVQARGARFTHHEFKQPMKNRLTNETWLKQLLGKLP